MIDMETQNQVGLTEETTVQPEKIGFWKKAEAFFDRNYALFFAPLLTLGLYIAMLIFLDVYPFGKTYTAASYDLSAQIAPFIEHLFDVFDGKSTLTYTYALMGGVDVTGTFLYFFISPFSFLFLIFGDGMVAHASSIVMAAKLATIAFAGTWFAKKLFRGIPDYLCVCIGVVYAYCGYTFVSNTYINWMDFLIYLPFATWAFRRFVKTGKFFLFSLFVACCIYTCFSIACFSMFIAFPVLIFYAIFCVEKERRNKFIAYLCLSFVVAILLALPILLPALSAYTNSARGGELFENLWVGFGKDVNGNPTEFYSSTFVKRFSESLYAKWSYVFSDTVFMALTIVWFFRKGFKDPFAKFMLVAGILTLLPVLVDESMNLLNMGSYMSYALRFGFLNALYFLGGACLALEDICFKEMCSYDGARLMKPLKGWLSFLSGKEEKEEGRVELNEQTPMLESAENAKKEKSVKIFSLVFLLIGIASAAFLFYYWYEYDNFLALFYDDEEFIGSVRSFAGKFAHSLGGMEVLVVFVVIIGLLCIAGFLLVANKKISPRLLSYVLILTVGVQILFYNNHIVAGNTSKQHVDLKTYQTLCEVLNEEDDSHFRVKDYGDKLTATAPFTGGCNSFSVFSSVIDKDNFATFELFGYQGNGKNTFKSAHNQGKGNRSEEFGDSFMGYKYIFVHEEDLEDFESGSYLKYIKPYTVTGKDGKETQLCAGNEPNRYYIFENEIVFPMAYKVDSGAFTFEKENTNSSFNRASNQRALYKFLRGKELADMKEETGSSSSLYVTPETARELSEYLWNKAADIDVGAGKIKANVTAKAGECLFLNFVASEGYTVTVNGKKAKLIENDLNFLSVALEEGENEVVFEYSSPYVKDMGIGVLLAAIGLLAVWLIVKKTKVVETLSPVIAWAGVLLTLAVLGFFMVYPTSVFIVKIFKWIIP